MQRLINVNSLGPLRVANAFLPLLSQGEMKRLCFVSSEAGSIERAQRTAWYGYCMSKAALNMGVKLVFNRLRPQGYTVRLYHPGWMRTYMGGDKERKRRHGSGRCRRGGAGPVAQRGGSGRNLR